MRAAVIVVTALLAFAAARCPNSCSGHGDCGGSDKCTCWPNWQGFDCSERTCEYDVAWATDARQNPHQYAECSGKGICDRTTGLCACFDGYTGSACRRSACPNDCSGHGKCRLIAELYEANSALSVESNGAATEGSLSQYGRWDGDKIQACVCDGGFFGPDCSQRNCPKGDDPLTICNADTEQVQTLTISSSYATDVQTVTLTAPATGLPIKGYFTLTANADTSSNIALSNPTTSASTPITGSALATQLQTDWATPINNPYVVTAGSGASTTTGPWVITFTDALTPVTASGAGLYSPTASLTVTLDSLASPNTITITLARTASGTPIVPLSTFTVSIDGNPAHNYVLTIPASGLLSDLLTNIQADAAAAQPFTTFLTSSGLTQLSTPGTQIVSSPGANLDEGDIVITLEALDDVSSFTAVQTYDDSDTAFTSAPTISVAAGGAGVFDTALTGAAGTAQFYGELVLHFTDSEGEVWTTGRIGTSKDGTNDFFRSGSNTATLIASALAGIPNFKVPKVTVTNGGADSTGPLSHSWDIAFDNERNSGVQNLLSCDPLPLGCQSAGCQPKYQQPKTWSTSGVAQTTWASHRRSYYTSAASGTAFGSASFTAVGSPLSPPDFTTLITADSILDNSGGDSDQATVLVRVYKVGYSASTRSNWGYRESDAYAYYTVEWDWNAPGIGSGAPASSCGVDGSGCTIYYIPTGKEDTTSTEYTAKGSTDVGVGFNHAPIGHGLYVNFGNAIAGLHDDGTNHEQLYLIFDVATVRCSVTAAAPDAEYEHLECSGRGSCDRTTGTCTCFEGHYGDHCGMQTILV